LSVTAAGFVGYGGASVGQLQLVTSELQMAHVCNQVMLSLIISVFSKSYPCNEVSVNAMLDQVIAWGGALKTLR
jgi:hypothetical protein